MVGFGVSIMRHHNISFSPTIERRFITLPLTEYSQIEWESCWYTPEEGREMQAKQKRIICRLEQGKRCKKEDSIRGLEKRTTEHRKRKRELRNFHVTALLEQQDLQCGSETFDWEMLAETSKNLSRECVMEASLSAIRDQREARQVYNRMGREKSPISKIISAFHLSGKNSREKVDTKNFVESMDTEDESVTEASYLSDSEFEDEWETEEESKTTQRLFLVEPVLLTTRFVFLLARTTAFLLLGIGSF
jgi:hypothetical protein